MTHCEFCQFRLHVYAYGAQVMRVTCANPPHEHASVNCSECGVRAERSAQTRDSAIIITTTCTNINVIMHGCHNYILLDLHVTITTVYTKIVYNELVVFTFF